MPLNEYYWTGLARAKADLGFREARPALVDAAVAELGEALRLAPRGADALTLLAGFELQRARWGATRSAAEGPDQVDEALRPICPTRRCRTRPGRPIGRRVRSRGPADSIGSLSRQTRGSERLRRPWIRFGRPLRHQPGHDGHGRFEAGVALPRHGSLFLVAEIAVVLRCAPAVAALAPFARRAPAGAVLLSPVRAVRGECLVAPEALIRLVAAEAELILPIEGREGSVLLRLTECGRVGHL